MKKFLIIEGCNFIDYPVGGQLTFAKQLIQVYGEDLHLVGVTCRTDVPIGKWIKLKINDKELDFFAFRRISFVGKKPIIPARISDFLAIRKYKNQIIKKNRNAITQAPELLIAIKDWQWESLCYRFPGVENPLRMPRYQWGKIFASLFDKQLFRALKKVNLILASADKKAIHNLVKRSNKALIREQIHQFPTRVDTNVFKPVEVDKSRDLEINHSDLILVSCGRINLVKGWELILESFRLIREQNTGVQLYFVGDGEDREKLESKIRSYDLVSSVHITGYQNSNKVLKWLNIADLILVGSHKEGWSISMLESLACGKGIVSTDVSGAQELISEGKNGYVVQSRNPLEYATGIKKGLELNNTFDISLEIVSKYTLSSLKNDLGKLWLR